jgi:hypothetical protein
MNTLALRLADFSENLLRIFRDVCGRHMPPLVYHYTDVDAFLSMRTNKELWLSDLKFMNDATERSYGYSLLQKLIRTQDVDLPDSDIYQTLEKPLYAICFCEDGNLLSQWRGYRAAVSIGFITDKIHQLNISIFDRVLYNDNDQQRLFKELLCHFKISHDALAQSVKNICFMKMRNIMT